ncbi:SDR family oxidoreductase [Actinoplanes sp. NPDC026619]|uniref:SDR family oxidoreductase n=1 Tax=Actinoplanes sp. NPDC026619 TaxID=3155798 RepID=UPI0033D9F90D
MAAYTATTPWREPSWAAASSAAEPPAAPWPARCNRGRQLNKGALNTLTFTLAKQLGERGITVNAVAPGIVDVDSNAAWLRDDPEQLAFWGSLSPFGRIGQPADIADVVAFLSSPDARWITGQCIDATGGAHL